MIEIERLTREILAERLQEICAVENMAAETSGGTYRHPWTRGDFTMDLPGKWTYSRLMRDNAKTIGFLVMSDKTSPAGMHYLHAHRAAVLKEVRRPNLLLDAYNDVFREAKVDGLTWFVTKQQSYHPAMLLWYIRVLGCAVLKERKCIEEFTGPLSGTVTVEADGKVVSGAAADREGQYFIAREL
jgi:hypothetical protein